MTPGSRTYRGCRNTPANWWASSMRLSLLSRGTNGVGFWDEHQVIWAPVQDLNEVMNDPQVKANGYLTKLEHPVLGDYETIDTPIRFKSGEVRARGPAPEIGQHTEEVLLENGYSWEQISEFRDQGVV